MLQNKERTAPLHSWHTSRHQETPKSVHASGTSGPRGDGAENGHSSGTSGPIASRDDGAVFLTAAKNQQRIRARGVPPHLGKVLLRTQDMILSQHWVRRDEQTESVCRIRFLDTDSSRQTQFARRQHGHTPHQRRDTPAPTCPHPHAPARPRTPGRRRRPLQFYAGIFQRLTFQLFKILKNVLDIENKGTTKKHTKKAENEYRAQQ